MNNKKIVRGLVIGMRKCGTTWLYENLKKSSTVVVSNKVKESGFFTKKNTLKITKYHELYPDNGRMMVEVDTSIIYDPKSAQIIFNYNPDMKILAIKREPQEYVISRYIHAKRRGFISENTILDALTNHQWFREELMFNKNMNPFYSVFSHNNICVLDFSLLKSEPDTFFNKSFVHLTSQSPDCTPDFGVVNPAKTSSAPIVTRYISTIARFFRRLGMYSFVNFFKRLRFHKNIENLAKPIELTNKEIDLIRDIVRQDEQEYKK